MNAEPNLRSPMTTSIKPPPSTQPETRLELYGPPHKAMRFLLANLLLELGHTRFAVVEEASAALEELALVLLVCDSHIEHEDTHVRPALIERAASATETLDAEHDEHKHQVAELRALANAVREATSAGARTSIGKTLYLHFSVFVAETLAHMAYEERVVQPLLERLFSDEELNAIQNAIVASIPPPDMLRFLGAMVPASNRDERVGLLGNVKANAPPEAFAGVMADMRSRLSAEDFADLADRLAFAQ